MSIEDIIEACGGAGRLERAATASGRKLNYRTVYKWIRNGIPERHWPLVMELSSATPDQLHAANEALRAGRVRPSCQVVHAAA